MLLLINFEGLGFAGKRQHVGGVVLSPKLTVEFPDRVIADEHNGCVTFCADRPQRFLCEGAPLLRVDLSTSLAIDNFNHFRFPIADFDCRRDVDLVVSFATRRISNRQSAIEDRNLSISRSFWYVSRRL